MLSWMGPSIEKRVAEIVSHTCQGECRLIYDELVKACKEIRRDTFLEIESVYNLTIEKVARYAYITGLKDGARLGRWACPHFAHDDMKKYDEL